MSVSVEVRAIVGVKVMSGTRVDKTVDDPDAAGLVGKHPVNRERMINPINKGCMSFLLHMFPPRGKGNPLKLAKPISMLRGR
jgi:hypothetical protein